MDHGDGSVRGLVKRAAPFGQTRQMPVPPRLGRIEITERHGEYRVVLRSESGSEWVSTWTVTPGSPSVAAPVAADADGFTQDWFGDAESLRTIAAAVVAFDRATHT